MRGLKDILTKEVLEELYIQQKLSMREIAEQLNVKKSAVHTYLWKYSINRNDDPRRKNIDKDTLYRLYVLEKKSKEEIQIILNCCKQTLDKSLKLYGIKTPYDNYTSNDLCEMYNSGKSLSQISSLTDIPKSRIRNILLETGMTLRDKSSCQNVNILYDKFPEFDINILQSQSKLKRKCQSFFKNNIANVVKKERGYKCEMCGSTTKLHAHHLTAQSYILNQIIKENQGLSDEELYKIIINDSRFLDKDNIKVVCETCHYTIYHPYTHYHANQHPSQCNPTLEGSTTIERVGLTTE